MLLGPRSSRRVKTLRMDGDEFILLLLEARNGILRFIKNLPDDARVYQIHTEWELCPPTVCLMLESESFEEVSPGEYPPRFYPEILHVDLREELKSALACFEKEDVERSQSDTNRLDAE